MLYSSPALKPHTSALISTLSKETTSKHSLMAFPTILPQSSFVVHPPTIKQGSAPVLVTSASSRESPASPPKPLHSRDPENSRVSSAPLPIQTVMEPNKANKTQLFPTFTTPHIFTTYVADAYANKPSLKPNFKSHKKSTLFMF